MCGFMEITDVYAREILDSRGNPTVEVELLTEGRQHRTGGSSLRGFHRGA